MNYVVLRPFICKTFYELLFGNIKYLGKFDMKSNKGISLGYSSNKKAYWYGCRGIYTDV